MNKKPMKNNISLQDVALELEQIAAKLRHGQFPFAGQELLVGEGIDFKQKQRLEGGMIKYEVVMRIPLAVDQHENSKTAGGERSRPLVKEKRTYQDKQLKKKINSLWKTIVNDVKGENKPSSQLVTELTANCQLYSDSAPALWREVWEECANLMVEASNLAVTGDFTKSQKAIEQTKQLKKDGHKKYK